MRLPKRPPWRELRAWKDASANPTIGAPFRVRFKHDHPDGHPEPKAKDLSSRVGATGARLMGWSAALLATRPAWAGRPRFWK